MGVSQSTQHLPPSSAATMIYLAQQRYEKEAPWKRDQLARQVRSDPDVLALNCWAVACEQPPGAIPNPGEVQTPQQFVLCFRHAVKLEPAASALDSWYKAMKLPVPSIFLRSEEESLEGEMEGWFSCASPRGSLCGPREVKNGSASRTGLMPGSATGMSRAL